MQRAIIMGAVGVLAIACGAPTRGGADSANASGLTGVSTASASASAGTDSGVASVSGGSGGGDTGNLILDVAAGTGNGGGGGGDSGCACQNVMDGIYVLNDSPPAVYFFDPPANTFTQVGTLGCSAPGGYVSNSMAIDRQGYAWINYYEQLSQSGKIFKAPLSDLGQCMERPYQQPPSSWWLLGMGYAVIDPNSSCDQLFIYNSDRYLEYPNFGPGGSHLAQYDEGNDSLEVIGTTDYPVGELTGTGDGHLFTFAAVSQGKAVLVNLDKSTGKEIDHTDLDIDITNAFAFAFWGGDVYFFTETAPTSGVSQVTRLDYDKNDGGGMSVYNSNTSIHIVGAGVSTCASYTPPG